MPFATDQFGTGRVEEDPADGAPGYSSSRRQVRHRAVTVRAARPLLFGTIAGGHFGPGSVGGSTALEQWRAQRRWPASYGQFWALRKEREGNRPGCKR